MRKKNEGNSVSMVAEEKFQQHLKIIEPYTAEVEIQGVTDILFHRRDVGMADAQASSGKGTNKVDNWESYFYVNEDGELVIPGENIHAAIVKAGKFQKDPRNPRASMAELLKAGIIVPEDPSFGVCKKDFLQHPLAYLDRRPAKIQRSGVIRTRPALHKGWRLSFSIDVGIPEYVNSDLLHLLVSNAGRFSAIGDHRPLFGRFIVTKFEVPDKEIS
jgi:hypothetical protein